MECSSIQTWQFNISSDKLLLHISKNNIQTTVISTKWVFESGFSKFLIQASCGGDKALH